MSLRQPPPRLVAPALILRRLACCCREARADEQLVGYGRDTEGSPEGVTELELWATLRSGKREGDSGAWDLRTALEYGLNLEFSSSGGVKGRPAATNPLPLSAPNITGWPSI